MSIVRRTLFAGELLRVGHVVSRPTSPACGEVERSPVDALVLPVAGVFAKHDGPRRQVIANANHALFLAAEQPYRISYPACIGDECLSLVFSKTALAHLLAETVAAEGFHSATLATHALLTPAVALDRSLLWRHLIDGTAEPLEIEETGVALLAGAVQSACQEHHRQRRAARSTTSSRRAQQVETVKEAISAAPAKSWTLSSLARLANTTPFHLTRIFGQEVGAPVHQYLRRTRLAKSLEAVLDADADLTAIALDTGFNSHSHFTASFRAHFGLTPTELRRQASRRAAAQLRNRARI